MAHKINADKYYVYIVDLMWHESISVDASKFCKDVLNDKQIKTLKKYDITEEEIHTITIESLYLKMGPKNARNAFLEMGIVVLYSNCYFGRDEGWSKDYIAVLSSKHDLVKINIKTKTEQYMQ